MRTGEMRVLPVAVIAAVVMAFGVADLKAAVVIDDFSEDLDLQAVSDDDGSGSGSAERDIEEAGDTRDLFVEKTTTNTDEFDVLLAAGDGSLSYSSDSDTSGFAKVQYDGEDLDADNLSTTPGLGGLNVVGGGATAFEFTIIDNDRASTNLVLSLWDDSTSESVRKNMPVVDSDTDPSQSLLIPFSDFSSVDLTALTAIELSFDAGPGVPLATGNDFEIGSFAAIPTPTALPAGLLLFGLGAMGRRRRAA